MVYALVSIHTQRRIDMPLVLDFVVETDHVRHDAQGRELTCTRVEYAGPRYEIAERRFRECAEMNMTVSMYTNKREDTRPYTINQ